MNYSILLYYCYVRIEDPEAFREEHHQMCLELNLRGRIIIAAEGLNGTVSGTVDDCNRYMQWVKSDPKFNKIEFKVENFDRMAFTKLHVRVKAEIVHSGLTHLDPTVRTGKYIEPREFKEILNSKDENTVIVDMRSSYEHSIGKFKGAITLDIENFREMPEKLPELLPYKNKKVITYCTGGIKCEKASAYLIEQGFENVYQLHGGIIKYGIEAGGENFEGKCYVFDNRIATEVNTVNPIVISKCYLTGEPTDRMVNCANPVCNRHIAMSEAGGFIYNGCCSEECMNHPEVRPYDGTGYYQKASNGYNPYKNSRRQLKERIQSDR